MLPQAKEFKYLGVLLMIDGKMDHEMDRWIGAASGEGVKRELSQKKKLLIYQLIDLPTLIYVHELWLKTDRIRLQIQEAKMSFLCIVAGHNLRYRKSSLNI